MKSIKRILALILALLIMTFCTCTAFAANINSQDIRFAVLGDSIASGYGLDSLLSSYGALVAKEKSYHLTNDAVPGHTTKDLLGVICHSKLAQSGISEADVISVSICGNDMIQFITNTDTLTLLEIMGKGVNSNAVQELLEEIEYNLEGICTELRALNPDAPIIFQTQYNPLYASPQFSSYAPLTEEFAPVLAEIFESLCYKFGNVFLIDVHSAFDNYYKTAGNYDIIQADGIHPTEASHKIIAELLIDKINELEALGLISKAATAYYLLGDADSNSRISVSDATTIQKITAGLLICSGDIIKLCIDADENGAVNIKDATSIQKHLADLPANPNIGSYMPYYAN